MKESFSKLARMLASISDGQCLIAQNSHSRLRFKPWLVALLVSISFIFSMYAVACDSLYTEEDFRRDQNRTVDLLMASIDVKNVSEKDVYEEIYISGNPSMILFYNNRSLLSCGLASMAIMLKEKYTNIDLYLYKISDDIVTPNTILNSSFWDEHQIDSVPALVFYVVQDAGIVMKVRFQGGFDNFQTMMTKYNSICPVLPSSLNILE